MGNIITVAINGDMYSVRSIDRVYLLLLRYFKSDDENITYNWINDGLFHNILIIQNNKNTLIFKNILTSHKKECNTFINNISKKIY